MVEVSTVLATELSMCVPTSTSIELLEHFMVPLIAHVNVFICSAVDANRRGVITTGSIGEFATGGLVMSDLGVFFFWPSIE